MSNLTYLNDATVLWNLKDRYYNQLIYVSSNPIQFYAYPIWLEDFITQVLLVLCIWWKTKEEYENVFVLVHCRPISFFGFFIMYRRWRQCSVPSHLQQLLGLLTLVASHTIMYIKVNAFLGLITRQVYNIWIVLKCIFSSNQIVHKISFSLCFWASDPLIDVFYWILLKKRSQSQNQRLNEILWMIWNDEKKVCLM